MPSGVKGHQIHKNLKTQRNTTKMGQPQIELPTEFIHMVEQKFNSYLAPGGFAKIEQDQDRYNDFQRFGLHIPTAEYEQKFRRLEADLAKFEYPIEFNTPHLIDVAARDGHPDKPTWGLSAIAISCDCGRHDEQEKAQMREALTRRKVWLRTDMANSQILRTGAHEFGHVLSHTWDMLPIGISRLAKLLGMGNIEEIVAEAFSVCYATQVLGLEVNYEQCALYCAGQSGGDEATLITGLGTASKIFTRYKEEVA